MLVNNDGEALEVGAVRQTPRGFDALAKTMGYDPGRAQKGIATLTEAKAFVESFRPWEMYEAGQGLDVDPVLRSPDGTTATAPEEQHDESAPIASTQEPSVEPDPRTTSEETTTVHEAPRIPTKPVTQRHKRWWEIWKSC